MTLPEIIHIILPLAIIIALCWAMADIGKTKGELDHTQENRRNNYL